MSKKTVSLVFLIVAVILVFVVVTCGIFYAWIVTNDRVSGGLINVKVADDEDSVIEISSFNDEPFPNDGYRIMPQDTFLLDLQTLKDINYFAMVFDCAKLTDTLFSSEFSQRDDLLLGNYLKDRVIEGGIGSVTEEFSINSYLNEKALSDAQKTVNKVAFLKKFTDANKLLDTFTVKIVSVDGLRFYDDPVELDCYWKGETKNYQFNLIDENHPLVASGKITTIEGIPNDGYLEITSINFHQGMSFEVLIEYGLNKYQPTMGYSAAESSSSVFEAGSYYALGYNCFTFQNISIGFSGGTV